MTEEFPDFAAIAQEAARDLLADINLQSQVIAREHDLKTKLLVWDNIIEHLNTLVAENSPQHRLLLSVVDKLTQIRDLIESYEVGELRFVSEEKAIAKKLSSDIGHRNWRLVKIEEQVLKKREKKFEKLEIDELKELKKQFFELGTLIEKSKAIKIKPTDTRTSLEKFKNEEEYYFLQIWRFASAYMRIISNLVTKEEILLRRIK